MRFVVDLPPTHLVPGWRRRRAELPRHQAADGWAGAQPPVIAAVERAGLTAIGRLSSQLGSTPASKRSFRNLEFRQVTQALTRLVCGGLLRG